MKKILYSLLSIIIFSGAMAQNFTSQRNNIKVKECGSDAIHRELMLTDPVYRQKQEDFELLLKNSQLNNNASKAGTIYKVPVVVHLMHPGDALGTGTNLTDEQVKAGIDYINQRFRKITGGLGDGNGVDLEIEFALAVRDESNNCTDGIVRTNMSGNTAYVNNGVNRYLSSGISDASLKLASRWDPTKYYNIYIVNKIDEENCTVNDGGWIAGYANFASAHGGATDASVMLACTYNDESSTTFTHELGHAFNLYHTFEGDNNGTQCPSGSGDFCADTPEHIRFSEHSGYVANYGNCAYAGSNSCDAGTTQDHMLNYMDYSYDVCQNEFTANQKTRVTAAMTTQRASYLESNGNMSLVPPTTATVDFTSAATVACSGGSITFTDESTCSPNTYINTAWPNITFSWTFDNGVDAPYTSTDQNPTITFNNSGTYDVTLEITNLQGTTSLTKTDHITVTSGATAGCSVSSGNNNNNFGCGVTSVSFNTFTNATSTFIPASAQQDFTCSVNTTVNVGTPYDLDVTYNSRNDGGHNLEVWIDWDNSGSFELSNGNGDNERVLTDNIAASSTGTPSTSVTPPATATLNTLLRMRVITDYTQSPTVCGNGFVQRADDYGVLVQGACTEPDVPTLSGTTTICSGNSTTLSINTGNLNDAAGWQWYTGSCGGTAAGSGTSINTSPSVTTTYYARGEGGCATPGSCGSITVTVNPKPNLSSRDSTDETCTGNDGTATINPSGGSGSYTYSWNTAPVQTTQTATGLAAGTYTVTVTDAVTTCFASGDVTVNDACVGSAPVADFSANQTTVCEGTTINFTDLSTNTPNDWTWSFPGGSPSSSTLENPSITYNTEGVYQVVLTASNAFGSDGETKVGYITVNACGSTELKPAFRKTYQAYSEIVACYPVTNAQEYEFEFTPSGGGAPITYNRGIANISFLLGWATGLSDGTTYDVRVRAKVGGSFGAYGNTHQLTTPSATEGTSVTKAYCGKIYASYSEVLACYSVTNAQEYEFEFTPSGGGAPITYTRGIAINSILLNMVSGLQDFTTYDVRVRAKVGGSYGPYGSSCQITTPGSSTTTVKAKFCNKTYAAYTDIMACHAVTNAEEYEFEFTPSGGGAPITYTRGIANNSITLDMVTGLQNSTTYDVRVRVKLSGSYGAYGASCQITTPSGASIGELTGRMANSSTRTGLIIYPNPNQGEYMYVELSSLSPNSELIVTDLYGKQIERMILNTDQSNYNTTIKFNQKLNSGFYMVTVVSNGQSITKKLIVR